jgi:uncharacterized protein YdeI (YjbR/CyaY-like superfamily)
MSNKKGKSFLGGKKQTKIEHKSKLEAAQKLIDPNPKKPRASKPKVEPKNDESEDRPTKRATKINPIISSKKRKRDEDDSTSDQPKPKKQKTTKKKGDENKSTTTASISPIFFDTPADLRAWFAENASTASELSLGIRKKASGEPSVNWKQAVDEALCYGWIDGRANSIDEKTYRQRFTPRRQGSIWSAVNIARVAVLTEEGRMTPAGLAAFERRIEARSVIYSHEQKGPITLAPEQEAIFRENKKAWAYFEKQPQGYKRRSLWHVISAKRAETKESRLTKLIDASARMERLNMF